MRRILLAVAALFGAAVSASAATVPYRTDAELVAISDRVVRGRVLDSVVERAPSGIIRTRTRVAVIEDFTGGADTILTVLERGGRLPDGTTVWIPGAPRFAPGDDVVLCLERTADGYRTVSMAFSAFRVGAAVAGDRPLTRFGGTAVVGGRGVAGVEASRGLEEFRRAAGTVTRRGRSRRVDGSDRRPRRWRPRRAIASTRRSRCSATGCAGSRWTAVRRSPGTEIPSGPRRSRAPTPTISCARPSLRGPIRRQRPSRWPSAARGTWRSRIIPGEDPYCTAGNLGVGLITFGDPLDELPGRRPRHRRRLRVVVDARRQRHDLQPVHARPRRPQRRRRARGIPDGAEHHAHPRARGRPRHRPRPHRCRARTTSCIRRAARRRCRCRRRSGRTTSPGWCSSIRRRAAVHVHARRQRRSGRRPRRRRTITARDGVARRPAAGRRRRASRGSSPIGAECGTGAGDVHVSSVAPEPREPCAQRTGDHRPSDQARCTAEPGRRRRRRTATACSMAGRAFYGLDAAAGRPRPARAAIPTATACPTSPSRRPAAIPRGTLPALPRRRRGQRVLRHARSRSSIPRRRSRASVLLRIQPRRRRRADVADAGCRPDAAHHVRRAVRVAHDGAVLDADRVGSRRSSSTGRCAGMRPATARTPRRPSRRRRPPGTWPKDRRPGDFALFYLLQNPGDDGRARRRCGSCARRRRRRSRAATRSRRARA